MRSKILFVAVATIALAGTTIGTVSMTRDNGGLDAAPLDPHLIADEIVVGFAGAMPSDFPAWVADQGAEILLHDDVLHWVSLRMPDAAAADDAIATLSALEHVRYAEHDTLMELQFIADAVSDLLLLPTPEWEPNDPMYSQQWGYPAIKAPQAWYVELGDHTAKVAVLDTGIEGDHVDLAANICGPHASFISGEPPLEDLHFHGTHVAGSVAAVSDNGIGVAGTSQSCLMSVQVCSRFGSCPSSGSSLGIRWAADNGADIISMSFGGSGMSSAQQDAVAYAYHEKGVLLIAAAGNSGCAAPDRVIYPAKFPEVVAVAALQSPGADVAGFSSCGPEVEIAAPGASVLSTNRLGGYRFASGTSMAAPHASGVAALILSGNPELSAPQLRCVLARTSDDILAAGPDIHTGWGRVNMISGLTQGIVPPTPEPTGAPNPNPAQLGYLLENSCTLDILGL